MAKAKATVKKSVKTAKKTVKKIAKKPVQKSAKKPAKKITPKLTLVKKNWADILTPLDDRVLVRAEVGEKVTPGGIIIPDTAMTTGNYKGEVLVVGRGHMTKKGRTRPMDVKKGDTVIFEEYAGSKIIVMGEELRLLRESELLGVWEK